MKWFYYKITKPKIPKDKTPLHEPKISEKTISEYFEKGVLAFSGEI